MKFPNKAIRAKVIANFVRAARYEGVVCFSCGNASRALKEEGLDVVDISPTGDLVPCRWWDVAKIRNSWPERFDATSGHLPVPLLNDIADEFRAHLGELTQPMYCVPTGSGETLFCLSLAYPDVLFVPVYSNDPATQYDERAPLNQVVRVLSGGGNVL